MINLILDKKGGINKGDIDIFETENKNEVYVIQLTKQGQPYNLTGKTVELSIIEKKRKYGDMLQLQVEDAVTGKVRLEIVSAITKQDGAYDFQLTVKGADGFTELFPVFRVDIKNNISTDLAGTIVSSPSFTILNDKLEKVTEWDAYFAETSGKLEEKYTTRLNELNTSLENIANKGTTVEVLERVTKEEIDRQIADGTIANLTVENLEIDKIDFFDYDRVNLIDNTKVAVGKAVRNTDGTIYDYANGSASDFIKVTPNELYSCTRRYNIAFYNANKQYISGLVANWTNPLTIPSGAYYIRLTLKLDYTTEMFVKGSTLPTEYIPFTNATFKFNTDENKSAFINALGISSSIDKIDGITINVLGDSISSISYSRPNWWEKIKENHNITVNNYSKSGTSIGYSTQTEGKGLPFSQRYLEMVDNVDLICVMGGTNDTYVPLGNWGDTTDTTFYGALNVLMTGLSEKYPNAKLMFFTPIQGATSYSSNIANPSAVLDSKLATDTLSTQLRAEAIKRKCNQYGIPCLDLFSRSGINGVGARRLSMFRDSDTLHPSILGNEIIGSLAENFILDLFN